MTSLPQVEDLFRRTDLRRKIVDIPVEQDNSPHVVMYANSELHSDGSF